MDIKLKQLSKRYKFEWIFRSLDYHFEAGKTYAVLGPNGSGKSTLLKVLSGYSTPSKGNVDFFDGEKPFTSDKVYTEISYAAPYIELIEEFTLTEMLDFHQKFKPFQGDLNTQMLIEILNFSKSKHKEIKYFSSGMKQRLKLVLAICSDTRLLLLDEPTTNLDDEGVAWYQMLIEKFTVNRLVIVASNVKHDYHFCSNQLSIMDYKKRVLEEKRTYCFFLSQLSFFLLKERNF
ncbi:MAG: ABC transporter ATP-binding protein [Saprospiraceae bacterium]|nr:ABC transporter ATP-binding protein [Saprospiraceae bacterium]